MLSQGGLRRQVTGPKMAQHRLRCHMAPYNHRHSPFTTIVHCAEWMLLVSTVLNWQPYEANDPRHLRFHLLLTEVSSVAPMGQC